MPDKSFFSELRKRKVFQTAAIYGAVAWGVTEVTVTVVEQLFLPQWVATLAVIGFVVGFPVAMFLAWTFDLTTQGIQRTTVSSGRGQASIAASLVLLIAGTAGLFFLIRPVLQSQETGPESISIVPNSVAVLPFDSALLESTDAYLGGGLSDELRDQLGRISGLRVAARSSSIAVLKRSDDARSMGEQLGVAMLVEGRLSQRGNKLRVSVQLIEGRTGLSLWSETFDRGPGELLTLQQTITERIVREVLPGAKDFVAQPATQNVTANELMLLARHYESIVRDKPEVDYAILQEAIRLYREATEADPDSALAHSRLAGALLYSGELEAAETPIFRALSLNSELSDVQYTLGLYYWVRGIPGAGEPFRKAVELNPNNPDALQSFANWAWMQGETEGPEELLRRAIEVDRLSLSRYGALGSYLGIERTPEKTLDVARQVEALFDGPAAWRLIGLLHEMAGEVDRAIAWTIMARDAEPNNGDHNQRLAELYVIIGDFETGLELEPEPGVGLLYRMRRYQELIDTAELLMIDEPHDVVLRYLLAFGYNATGQFEAALRILKSTGLPDSVLLEVRASTDMEGFSTLMNAAYGAGETEVAQGLARFWITKSHPVNKDWWQSVNMACAMAVAGNHAAALDRLTHVRGSVRLPVRPVLMDSPCLESFAEEPRYQEILGLVEARRKALRERLPTTLAEFNVSL
jgi:TolB-like protein/tetratricopeptide (TPR) repeat protein